MVGGGGGRAGGRVRLAMMAIGFVPLAITVPVAFALSLTSRKLVLMVGTMALFVEVAVAVEAAAGVQRLAIHTVVQLGASADVSVRPLDQHGHRDKELGARGGRGSG